MLKSDAYVPQLGRREKLAMLAEDPADLVETMLCNIFEEVGEPLLRAVHPPWRRARAR